MKAIWIDAHVWEHERREEAPLDGRLYRAGTLWEALEVISQEEQEAELVWVAAQLADREAVTNA